MKFYNFLLEKFILPTGDLFFNTATIKSLSEWRNICNYSEQELTKLQEINLKNLLQFAVDNSQFYSNLKEKFNEDPYVWIKEFPIMKKPDYLKNIDSIITEDKRKLIKKVTSGSSGIRGVIYMNKDEEARDRAIQMLWWEWAGWHIGKPILQTGMNTNRNFLKTTKDILLRTKYISAFNLSSKSYLHILKKFRNKSNYHLGGYASSLYVMAKICGESKLNEIQFDAAISWGDKMFSHYREEISTTFKCKVFDTYGLSEGLKIAAQHDLEFYYIMTPHVYLEILDSNGKEVKDGELGYVVASRLDSKSMPLIRYYTGDLAIKLNKEKYPLKRKFNFPLLEKVIGRDTDIVYLENGNYLIVHFFTGIFEYIEEIKQFRILQKDTKGIEIEYIKSSNFKASILNQIENLIKEKSNSNLQITWREVNYIAPTASGKPQIIKSYLTNKL